MFENAKYYSPSPSTVDFILTLIKNNSIWHIENRKTSCKIF